MAYNISSIKIIDGGPLVMSEAAHQRYSKHPEGPCDALVHGASPAPGLPGFVKLYRIEWHGGGPDRSAPLLREALSHTMGSADLLLCWERGDDYTGLRVRDGVVVEHAVRPPLGPATR